MRTVRVELGARAYPIHIGAGLLSRPELFQPYLGHGKTLIVSDDNVAPLYLEGLRATLAGADADTCILGPGEHRKTLATAGGVLDALAAHRCGRDATVIALGGGVVGDIAGFAAACYARGIAYVQVPTTLLAQVDSSVGGKTGVNHPAGKNLIGAFHQPCAVIADLATLATLEERQLRAGLAEVIKYGLILDEPFLSRLEEDIDRLLERDAAALGAVVARSCELKAQIVAQDERESGRRALLNLGHTFGHAIEKATGYGQYLHGEAVAMGMMLAAQLSYRLGWLDGAELARVRGLLVRAQLPVEPPQLDPAELLDAMRLDKKARDGKPRLVLLERIGAACLSDDYPMQALEALLGETLAPGATR